MIFPEIVSIVHCIFGLSYSTTPSDDRNEKASGLLEGLSLSQFLFFCVTRVRLTL